MAYVVPMERKMMAHFINSAFSTTTASWYRLGEDLEEFNVEMNPDIEQKKNILGANNFIHNGYETSASAEPFYARENDELFPKLQEIVDNRSQYEGTTTDSLEVHLWDAGTTSGTYVAYKQQCYVTPTSYGGDTSGYQIPFTVYYVGQKAKGTYNTSTKVFTPDA